MAVLKGLFFSVAPSYAFNTLLAEAFAVAAFCIATSKNL